MSIFFVSVLNFHNNFASHVAVYRYRYVYRIPALSNFIYRKTLEVHNIHNKYNKNTMAIREE